jgi:hypothetical protein
MLWQPHQQPDQPSGSDEMFTWLNKQGVESEKGFVVQITGQFTAEYREGTKRMTVDVESGLSAGKPSIIIDPHAFAHWDGDLAGTSVPAQKQAQILRNFKSAMEFQGLAVVVEGQ